MSRTTNSTTDSSIASGSDCLGGLAGSTAVGVDAQSLDWSKGGGLLPAIVQHWRSGAVLMLGYMNADALAATTSTGKVTFFSRSKDRLWTKGETSGHFLMFKSVRADCDHDALLVQAEPAGPTCHLGTASCFGNGGADAALPAHEPTRNGDNAANPPRTTLAFLAELDALVAEREHTRPPDSYTTRLFEAGIRRIAQKVGEEGVETALAATAQDDGELIGEAADLLYHLIVLLCARGKSLADVVALLDDRHAKR